MSSLSKSYFVLERKQKKKCSLFINEKFVERMHYAWIDTEHDAQSWSN